MPPKKKKAAVATKTQSVTSTKLAVATAALIAASGLAFAALPAGPYVNEDGAKCGVNSYTIREKCGKGGFQFADVTCHDGSSFTIGSEKGCYDTKYLSAKADSGCFGRCVEAEATKKEPVKKSFCKDSDEGNNPMIKGEVKLWDEVDGVMENWRNYEDTCEPAGPDFLEEQVCIAGVNVLASLRHACEFGCSEGVCLPGPAIEPPTVSIDVATSSAFLSVENRRDGEFLLGSILAKSMNGDAEIESLRLSLAPRPRFDMFPRDHQARGIEMIEAITLKFDGELLGRTAPTNRGIFDFDALDISLSEDEEMNIAVEVTMKEIEEAEDTQIPVTISLVEAEVSDANGNDVDGENLEIGRNYNGRFAPVVHMKSAPEFDVYPVSDAGFNGGRLVNADMDFFQFGIRSVGASSVSWKTLSFKVEGFCDESPVVTDCIHKDLLQVIDANSGDIIPGSFELIFDRYLAFTSDLPITIPEGQQEQYMLTGSVDGFGPGNVLRFSLHNGALELVAANSFDRIDRVNDQITGSFVWSDDSGNRGNLNDPHWVGSKWVNMPERMRQTFTHEG